MGIQTAAGSTLAITAGVPATQDAGGYTALTYTSINNVEKIGTFGASAAKVEFQPLLGAKQKLKGSFDYGALAPSIALDGTDAGQALMKTAANDTVNALFGFRLTLQDGSKYYFQARVLGMPVTVDGADSVVMAAPAVEICVKPVEVAAGS